MKDDCYVILLVSRRTMVEYEAIESWELFSIAKSSLAGLWVATVYRRCTSNVVPSKEPELWSLRAAVCKANRQPGNVP